jgi:hypothetical protein
MIELLFKSRCEKENAASVLLIDDRNLNSGKKTLMKYELHVAFQDLANWIYRHSLEDIDSFHNFSEKEFDNYKSGGHSAFNDVIKEKIGEDVTVSNFVECFIYLLKLVYDKYIVNDVFFLVDTFIKRKKRFGSDRYLGVDQFEYL